MSDEMLRRWRLIGFAMVVAASFTACGGGGGEREVALCSHLGEHRSTHCFSIVAAMASAIIAEIKIKACTHDSPPPQIT